MRNAFTAEMLDAAIAKAREPRRALVEPDPEERAIQLATLALMWDWPRLGAHARARRKRELRRMTWRRIHRIQQELLAQVEA